MSVSDRLNKLTTDITNAYTSIENKGGTIPANKNTENMSTAINSIEVIETATAEGESLSLTNTKAMPYKDYVVEGKSEQDGEPSPSIPSEIHSVADDVNLIDYTTVESGPNTTVTLIDNGFIVNGNYAGKITINNLKPNTDYFLQYIGENITGTVKLVAIYAETTQSTTIKNINNNLGDTFNTGNNTTINIWFYAGTGSQGQRKFTNIKLQKGTEATPYSPYNQGTVTIKQRGTTENKDYTIQTSPLRSLPNGVKDTIEDDGIHKRVGRVVLDGRETIQFWSTAQTGYKRFAIVKTGIKASTTGLCSHFTYNANQTGQTQEGESICIIDDYITIKIRESLASNVNGLKTWLSNNNVTLDYLLATELIEPFTQQQATTYLNIIKTGSYEGTTNIYTDEDVKPTIGVGYYKKS